MQRQDHSYLDLSVLPEVRPFVVSADAAVLFRNDLSEILWANANGARLFGGRGVVDLIGTQIPENVHIIKQLRITIAQMKKKKPIIRGFRLNSGSRVVLLHFEITKTALPDDAPGFLVRNISENATATSEYECCTMAIETLDGFADAAAILDDFGIVIAASNNFAQYSPTEETLDGLIYELRGEGDRLIKRAITSESGQTLAVGLARLDEDPGRHLIVVADPNEATEEFSDELDTEEISVALISETPFETEHSPEIDTSDISQPQSDFRQVEPPVDEPETDEEFSNSEDETPEVENEGHGHQGYEHEDGGHEVFADEKVEATASSEDANAETELLSSDEDTSSLGENFLYLNEQDDVRFAWTIDRDLVFQTVSPELSKTVGPNAADIIGRSWSELSTVYGFDSDGEIAKKFTKQDTWSGKSVLWPVQGTDMAVPVDLAALPVFGLDRSFEGFKGFGIIRTADAIIDQDAIGLALVGVMPQSANPDASSDSDTETDGFDLPEQTDAQELMLGFRDDEDTSKESDLNETSSETSLDDSPILDNANTAYTVETEAQPSLDRSNIVKLVPRRASDNDSGLSEKENSAFKVIGDALRDSDTPQTQVPETAKKIDHLDTSLMENLPVSILVYRTDELLFANDKMLLASGYENLDEITQAGGVEALLNTYDDESTEGRQYLTTKSGSRMTIDPVLHTVPWKGEKALLLSFSAKPELVIDEPLALEISTSSEIQNILDTASDGIVLMESDGSVISINASAEALFGITYDEASNQSFKDMFAQESRETVSEYLNSLAAPGVERLLNDGRDVIASEKNGGLIPIFLTITPMETSDKLCAVVRDMTSWKKVEEELIQSRRDAIQASEQKTDFLAHVSHEIRTPLNAIIGFSDVMLEEKFGPIDNQRYREYLRDINRSGSHVLELVNDLLDLSKIEAGKLELSFEAVELNQIVSETVALLQPQANSNRIIIRTSLSRSVPKVVADPRSIRQIILNLVSNAIKFSPANSQVIVSTIFEANGEVALRVRDTGNGMSEIEIEEAMKPFHQLHTVSERAGEGTGLGLPLTKALVEANRALFDLESEPGTGTIAHVQFPIQRVLSD